MNGDCEALVVCAAVAQLHSSDDGTPMPPPFTAMLYHMTAPVIKVQNSYSIPDIHDWAFTVARSLRKDEYRFVDNLRQLEGVSSSKSHRISKAPGFEMALMASGVPFYISKQVFSVDLSVPPTVESVKRLLHTEFVHDEAALANYLHVATKVCAIVQRTLPPFLIDGNSLQTTAIETLRILYGLAHLLFAKQEVDASRDLQWDDEGKLLGILLRGLHHIARSGNEAAMCVGRLVLEMEGGIDGILSQALPTWTLCNMLQLLCACRILDRESMRRLVDVLAARGVLRDPTAPFRWDLVGLVLTDPVSQQQVLENVDAFMSDLASRLSTPWLSNAVFDAINSCVIAGTSGDAEFVRRIVSWTPSGSTVLRDMLRDMSKLSGSDGVAVVKMLVTAHQRGMLNLADEHRSWGVVAAEIVLEHKLMEQGRRDAELNSACEKDVALRKVLCRYI